MVTAATARPGWSGSITFGMVQFPVRLWSAQRDRDVRFHQVHRECGNRINSQSVCRTCDREVERTELVKGYAVDNERLVLMDDEDFERLPLASTKTVEVTEVVVPATVRPELTEKTYWVGPDDRQKVGHKAFCLFRDALERSGRVAIGKIAMRQGKELLCAIRPHGKALALQVLHWADEMVDDYVVQASVSDVQVTDEEMELAGQLIESLVNESPDLTVYEDAYRQALETVIEAKLEGKEPVVLPQPKKVEADLMAALKASVKAAKAA